MKVKEETGKVGLKLNIQKTKIMASSPIPWWQIDPFISPNRWGNSGNSERLYLGGSKITADGDCSHEIKRSLLLGRKVLTNINGILKSRATTLPTKVCLVKAMAFPVVMYGYELNYKEIRALKNWCFWTMVLEKTLESPLDCKKIQPVDPKGNQAWIFIGRTGAEAETPIIWPRDKNNWLIWKDPDAGKDWRREEKGTTEDEMVGWHHQLNGHEFEQTPGVVDGQRGLACCSSWGRKESDTTERLNWTQLKETAYICNVCIAYRYKIWKNFQSVTPYVISCSEIQLFNASSLSTKGIIFSMKIQRKDLLIIASIATENLGISPFSILKSYRGFC